MKHARKKFFFAIVIACGLMRGEPLRGQPENLDERLVVKVKSAYLLNFTKFVTWPTDAFRDEQSPLVIGIVGSDPFGPTLDQTVKDQQVAGRGLEVRRLSWHPGADISEVKRCHLLYVSSSLGDNANALIAALGRAPVLLVGEGKKFTRTGGIISFIVEEGRIVFCANQKAAEKVALKVSSQLLKLGRPIND